jgi:hypothetical protein
MKTKLKTGFLILTLVILFNSSLTLQAGFDDVKTAEYTLTLQPKTLYSQEFSEMFRLVGFSDDKTAQEDKISYKILDNPFVNYGTNRQIGSSQKRVLDETGQPLSDVVIGSVDFGKDFIYITQRPNLLLKLQYNDEGTLKAM